MVTGSGKTNNLLNPKPKPKLHNAFAILSQLDAPTYYDVPSPALQMDNNRTILPPGSREHYRQRKIFRCQHIKITLGQLCKSDDQFLNNSITYSENEGTAFANSYTNNAKRVAIDSAHAQHDQLIIGLTQCGCNTAYRLGSVFNRTIKKLNRNKHVSFTKQDKVHLFDATTTPIIMLTYDSGDN
jgi:hypothetical protein